MRIASDIPLDSTSTVFRHGSEVYQIAVGPLPRTASYSMPVALRRLFLVTIRGLSASSGGQSVMQFGSALGLTPSEVRMCGLLAQNHTLKDAADALCITHETARHRLKTIFQKTSTNRQSELVSLLKRLN
jgi:DNA-binding CsgD family transcriptional regulator